MPLNLLPTLKRYTPRSTSDYNLLLLLQVTVDMFCEAAVTYAKGVLPHTDGGLSPQQQVEFKEANILKKVRHNLCVCVVCVCSY